MIKKKDNRDNIIVKGEEYGKNSDCYVCGLKIKSPIKVHIEHKSTRNAHISCMIKRIEEEMFSHNRRIEILNKMNIQILKYPKEIEEDKIMVTKQKIIKELK